MEFGTYALIVWLATATPGAAQKMPFGPFNSIGQCEDVYRQVSSRYIGTVPLQHECRMEN